MNSAVSSQLDDLIPTLGQTAVPDAIPDPVFNVGNAPQSTAKVPPTSLEDILVYDPASIAAYYSRHPLQIVLRLIEILWLFSGYGLGLLWDKTTHRSQKNELKRAVQLRRILTQLGPAYIKVGQALSTRPDLVPPSYMGELVKLQDQLPPFSNETAYRFITEELGQPPEAIYDELSTHPIAAASLGQVYKGRLKTGEEVAVKVQRPGLAQKITRDIYILRGISQWATDNIKQVRSDLVSIMDEFGARIFEEMDYNHEAQNAERFAALYGYLPEIIVPAVYPQYTGRRVMTMEWIDGMKLTQPEKLQAHGLDATYVIEVGVQCSLRQLLEHGFFHADPHPGNLLVTPEGKLAYLDFGMMCEVEPYQRYGLIEAIVHMVNRDFESLAQDYIKLEFLDLDTDLTPIIPALAEVFNNALGASVAELNLKSMTDEFSSLMYEYPFRVPAYYALIIRSLVTLDGIAISVDPDFKVLSKAYPYVSKRLLTDPAPELRESLQELLFKDGSFRWNRLENLLRNARDSDDYDLAKVLNQTLEFLFSERGRYIRDRIADELAKGLDNAGYQAFNQLQHSVRSRLGFENGTAAASVNKDAQAVSDSWEHLVRILKIIRETKGFDTQTLAMVLPKVLFKPETHHMGQRVVNRLAQRAVARLIREILLSQQPTNTTPSSLPAAEPTKALTSVGRLAG